jgi:tetratricopeptide (TPR) repeat protein
MKKFIASVLALALLLSLAACGAKPVSIPNPPIVMGEKYLLDLDYEQALLQFDEAIVIDPKNPRGYLGKADALLHLDRQADAVATLQAGAKAVVKEQRAALKEAAVEVKKSPVDGFIGLSVAYILLGFREIALALLKRVCEELPEESRLKAVLEDLQSIIAKESAMPDIINKTLDEAKALLDAAGIAYEVKYENGDGTGNAVVINQEVKSVVLIVGEGSESQEISVSSTTTLATSTTENTTVPTTVKNTTENTTVATTQKTTQKSPATQAETTTRTTTTATTTKAELPYVSIKITDAYFSGNDLHITIDYETKNVDEAKIAFSMTSLVKGSTNMSPYSFTVASSGTKTFIFTDSANKWKLMRDSALTQKKAYGSGSEAGIIAIITAAPAHAEDQYIFDLAEGHSF